MNMRLDLSEGLARAARPSPRQLTCTSLTQQLGDLTLGWLVFVVYQNRAQFSDFSRVM